MASARGEKFRREQRNRRVNMRRRHTRIIVYVRTAQRIALVIMAKGGIGDAAILIRFAKRKVEVKTVFVAQIILAERTLHRSDIPIIKLDRFEIGEAPPCFTKLRGKADRIAVSGDTVGLPPYRFERMTVRHPDFGMLGRAFEDMFVKLDRFVIIANLAHRRRAQIGIANIIGFIFDQRVKLSQRILHPVLAVKHRRKV